MLERVLTEHRRFIVILAVALVANAGVYAGVIYPLAARVADADNRAGRAARALRDARREFDAAKEVATSRERAEAELRTFYHDMLPADLDAAHRLTYLDLAQRARQDNLKVSRRTASEDRKRGSGFGRLAIAMVLEGQYRRHPAVRVRDRDVAGIRGHRRHGDRPGAGRSAQPRADAATVNVLSGCHRCPLGLARAKRSC